MKDGGVVTIDNSIIVNAGHSRIFFLVGIKRSMPAYKFEIGQTVFLLPSLIQLGGAYIVTRKLPERNGERQYRVKSADEPHERVVRESELSDAP